MASPQADIKIQHLVNWFFLFDHMPRSYQHPDHHQSSIIRRLGDAYVVYKFLSKSPNNSNTTEAFFKFLGILKDSKELTQEAEAKIQWLLSEHAETLYKAWKARHG